MLLAGSYWYGLCQQKNNSKRMWLMIRAWRFDDYHSTIGSWTLTFRSAAKLCRLRLKVHVLAHLYSVIPSNNLQQLFFFSYFFALKNSKQKKKEKKLCTCVRINSPVAWRYSNLYTTFDSSAQFGQDGRSFFRGKWQYNGITAYRSVQAQKCCDYSLHL